MNGRFRPSCPSTGHINLIDAFESSESLEIRDIGSIFLVKVVKRKAGFGVT